jgi:hypothetical protein
MCLYKISQNPAVKHFVRRHQACIDIKVQAITLLRAFQSFWFKIALHFGFQFTAALLWCELEKPIKIHALPIGFEGGCRLSHTAASLHAF